MKGPVPRTPAPNARWSAAPRCSAPTVWFLAGLSILLAWPAAAAGRRERKATASPAATAPAWTSGAPVPPFAPLPPEHPLAGLWNDPDFARRLWGSYGFLSEREPRLSAEEQTVYRDTILPLLREDPEKAVPALEAAAGPGASALFDYTLGTVHFQRGDFTNAVKHFETALAKFPDFLRAQRNLALALVREGRYAQAIPALTRTLTLGGADGRIYALLAFAQVQEGQYLAAAAAYQQALLYEPDNFDYRLGLVKCYVATANHGAALILLDELLARHPDREALWTLRANLHVQQNQLGRAIISLEMLRKLGRAAAAQLSLLGDLYLAEAIPDLALSAYLEAARLDGGTNLARALRAADLLAGRGAWEEAHALLDHARALAGANLSQEDELKWLRLEARVALGRGEGERAIQTLERLLEVNPMDGEALLLAGDYYKQHGDPERAAFRYAAAAKVAGFEAPALVKLAQVHVEARRYTQALELLRRAQKIQPRDNVQRYLEQVEQVAARARS